MGRSYAVVEGHGESKAMENLLRRLSADQGRGDIFWMVNLRFVHDAPPGAVYPPPA